MKDAKFLELKKTNNIHKLEQYFQTYDIDLVCSELNNICLRDDGPIILQMLLDELSSSTSNQLMRIKISRTVLQIIEKKIISPRLIEKLVTVLATQVESFSAPNIITLIDSCLEMMRKNTEIDSSNCWKDLIPKLLNKIIEKDNIEHNGSKINGTEYKSEIVIAICLNDWPDDTITNIASMFVEMPLSEGEHIKVVNKLCKRLLYISLQEVPPLVHQILQLTKEQHFAPLFLALVEVFDEKLYSKINAQEVESEGTKSNDLKEIQTVEGTVLYHIYSAVSSISPHIVKEFLKSLKDCVNSPEFILSPFSLTFLLTISCVSYTFEEEILSILKATILRSFAEEEKTLESAWLETITPSTLNIDEIFYKIIYNCFKERDKVLQGLVNLSFSLLDTTKTRGKEVRCDKVWKLGISLLVNLIKKYGDVTNSILQTLVNQISQVHESTQYTDCLFQIARKNPLNLLDCSALLIQLLDNICARFPGNVGKRVVSVILPLSKLSQSLRDNLIIVLRKSLFPKDKNRREMAVSGILELLKDLKISNLRNLSQSMSHSCCGLTQIYSQSSAGSIPSHTNEGICIELLTILREVFKHQHEIKTVFYRGLCESIQSNPELGCHALDILQNQFEKYLRLGEEIPPLHFDKTVIVQGANAHLLEPIAHLLFSIGLILVKIDEDSLQCSKMRQTFDSLCQRMSDSDVPHFFFGKDFSGSVESLVMEEEIRQILGVYEALMGYVLCSWTVDSSMNGQVLNSLFRGYSRLSDYAKSLGKQDKKKFEDGVKNKKNEEMQEKKKETNKIVSFRFPGTTLNFRCTFRLLSLLYESSLTWASEESTTVIKGRRELHRYCFNAVLSLIKQAQQQSAIDLTKDSFTKRYLTQIGRILYMKCLKRIDEMKDFDVASALSALECFAELINLVLLHFRGKFSNFLADITDIGVENGIRVQLKTVLDDLLDQLSNNLKSDEGDSKEEIQERKLSFVLISIAATLCNQLPRGGAEIQKVLDKIKSVCKETKVEAPNIAKAILNLLLMMDIKCKSSGNLLLDLTLCLCDNITLIDDEMNIDEHTKYAVVNEKSANICLIAVCDALRFHINEIVWILSRLKAELVASSLKLEQGEDVLYEKERELCRRINFVVKVLSILCTMAIPPGIYADAVLKEIGNLYNKMICVTKYFITKVGKYRQQLQNSRFDKTVKMIDHELTKNMYFFTEHLISDGTGSDEGNASKTKKDPTFLKNKCLKETKIIPKIIFEKEEFQKFVLQLSKKSKINLAAQTKQAMVRDYRLYARHLKEIIEKENFQNEEAEMELENTNETCESDEPSKKKPKMSQ